MEIALDEGIRTRNNIPMPIECLLSHSKGIQSTWNMPHYHDYIELLYIFDGAYEVKVNGAIETLPRHSMFIIPAGEPHVTRRITEDHLVVCIKFLPQVLYSSEQSVTELEYSIPYVFGNLSQCRKFDFQALAGTGIHEAFQRVREETENQGFGYELAQRAYVLQIFLWVLRQWHKEAGGPELAVPNRDIAARLYKAREFINENYATVTLASAAQSCGLSYGYFSRVWSTYMQVRFSDYVNQVRVNQTMLLLASTDESITQIALGAGFSTTSYYIQTFRKYKSISPNRFRKLFRSRDIAADSDIE